MTFTPPSVPSHLENAAKLLKTNGFAYVHAPIMRAALQAEGLADWDRFAASWDDLGVDRYMADGGRYRRRRFATFTVRGGEVLRKLHQPHYQSRDYNPLNGGIARWFDPVIEDIQRHPVTLATIHVCDQLFTALTPKDRRPNGWHVEMHQFRIEANSDIKGEPTPEGMHQDGVDWVLALLVRRENVASGETRIADLQRNSIGGFVLTEPFDSALVDDARVYHGVTSIHPLDPTRPAWRDVLVMTFRRE
ncbi:2OG-Fe dioxygenase family protein [Methyloferula stellata]|uniref:2OG-Fe dioxygenase family protein n=1 Tax=Methyloferula stellata TaxID=876270 RepID=UPI00047D9B8F|nr:2OG-Fe dioxygenase family protein [Methyloferula stellata]